MSLRSLISVLFLSAAALSPQIAHAQYGLSSSSNSNAQGGEASANDSHTGLVGPISSVASCHAGSFTYIAGSGGALGNANYGILHAAAASEGFVLAGSGNNVSDWFDTVTVASPTLPYGSPVTLTCDRILQRVTFRLR